MTHFAKQLCHSSACTAQRHASGSHSIHATFHGLLHRLFLHSSSKPNFDVTYLTSANGTVLYFTLCAQLFLLPQRVPHIEHSNTVTVETGVTHSHEGCDKHALIIWRPCKRFPLLGIMSYWLLNPVSSAHEQQSGKMAEARAIKTFSVGKFNSTDVIPTN